jgi:hypothetical protein
MLTNRPSICASNLQVPGTSQLGETAVGCWARSGAERTPVAGPGGQLDEAERQRRRRPRPTPPLDHPAERTRVLRARHREPLPVHT